MPYLLVDAYFIVSYSLPLRVIAPKRKKSVVVENPLTLIMQPLLTVVTANILTQQSCSVASKVFSSILMILIHLSYSPILFKHTHIQHISCPPHLLSSQLKSTFLLLQPKFESRATPHSSLLIYQAQTLSWSTSLLKNTAMASRGNRRRSSADSLTRELDELEKLETLSSSNRGEPVFCSTASIYGARSRITIIPSTPIMYSLPAHPPCPSEPTQEHQAKSKNWRTGKRKPRSTQPYLT